MKKRKSGSTTFWVTFCVTATIAGISPAIANADPTLPIPVTSQAPTVQIPTLHTDDKTSTPETKASDAPSKAHDLTLAELKPLIPGLAIYVDSDGKGGQKATLYGAIPAASGNFTSCGNFSILSSPQGFTIHDKGGFASCLAQWKSSGQTCDDDTACSRLSQVGPAKGSSVIECQSKVVTYLDHSTNPDAVPGTEWSTTDLSVTPCLDETSIKQNKEDAANAIIKKRAEDLQQEILSCAKSAKTIGETDNLLQDKSLDAATVEDLKAKIAVYQKQFDDKEAAGIVAKVKLAVNKGKVEDFDDLEDDIYTYLGKSPTEGNKMVPLIYAMAQARTTADGADDDSIDRAAKMLNDALDPDAGITMKAANRKILEAAVATGGDLDQKRLQLAYQSYETVRDKKGEYQMTPWGMTKVSATDKAAKHYAELAKSMKKELDGQLKSMGCIDRKGVETDKASNKDCTAVENQEQAMADIPSQMEVAHQTDVAQTQQAAASQQAAALATQGQRQYVMGPNGVMMPQPTQATTLMPGQYGQYGAPMINPNYNFAPQGQYGQQIGAPQYIPSTLNSGMNTGMYSQYPQQQNAGYNGYYMGAQPMFYHN